MNVKDSEISCQKYLEINFWKGDSDVKLSDNGNHVNSNVKLDQRAAVIESTYRFSGDIIDQKKSKSLILTKDSLKVTKFLKVLKLIQGSPIPTCKNPVYGTDLTAHVKQSKTQIPQVVVWCIRAIEKQGEIDMRSLKGVYRLSGQVSHIKALRLSFDAVCKPNRQETIIVHSIASLSKK